MDSPCPSLRANIAQLPRRTSLQDSVVYYVVAGKAARTSEGSGCRKCVPSTCKHRGSTQPQVGGRANCRGGQGSEAGKWSTSRAECANSNKSYAPLVYRWHPCSLASALVPARRLHCMFAVIGSTGARRMSSSSSLLLCHCCVCSSSCSRVSRAPHGIM